MIDSLPVQRHRSLDDLIAGVSREVPALTDQVVEALSELDRPYSGTTNEKSQRATETTGVIGVFSGIKPTALLDLNVFGVGRDEVNDIVKRLGLEIVDLSDGQYSVVSRYNELATATRDVIEDLDDDRAARARGDLSEANERLLGTLLGYPKTAVEYYIKRLPTFGTDEELQPFDVPEDDELYSFIQLILSPENHEEEMNQYVRPLKEAVQTMAPETYKEMIRTRRSHKIRDRVLKLTLGFRDRLRSSKKPGN